MSEIQTGKTGPAAGEHDWPVEVADRLESVVVAVRDRTTVPITRLARILVLGIVAAAAGLVAGILVLVALVRIIDVYLPFGPYAARVWVAYAGLGAIFLLLGAFCWSKRSPKEIKE